MSWNKRPGEVEQIFYRKIAPGWLCVASSEDMKRWDESDVMPEIQKAREYAENVVRVRPPIFVTISNDIVIKITGKPDCVVIVNRYVSGGPKIDELNGPMRGLVWIGTKAEAKKHRKATLKQIAQMGARVSHFSYRPAEPGTN